MKISLITDEISADPETAIELGVEWGVRDFELRGFYTDRVPLLSEYQKQRLRDALDEYQARVIAVGSGLFKSTYPSKQAPRLPLGWMDRAAYAGWAEAQRLVHYHLYELLPASLDFANEFGAPLLVIFGFDRAGAPPGPPPEEVLNSLRLAAERAAAAGVQLVLENEDGFWADTGARTAQLVQAVDHPALAVNWDPGNAFFADDEPYPRGYQAVRGLLRHVHFKDARRGPDGALSYVAEGQAGWPDQIRALAADGYDGFISIETHLRPKVFAARAALERLRRLIAAAEGNSRAENTMATSKRSEGT
jgi:sugar phosphate isomerase/epimerase